MIDMRDNTKIANVVLIQVKGSQSLKVMIIAYTVGSIADALIARKDMSKSYV